MDTDTTPEELVGNPTLYDMSRAHLEALMQDWGQPAYRAQQIYRQLYVNLAAEVQAMTSLPLALRQRLQEYAPLSRLRLVTMRQTDKGWTRKALFALPDDAVVETVLMIYPDRATVCVSTQAGCAMGCSFCATGRLGLQCNLSSGDMIAQVLWAARELRGMTNPADARSQPSLNVVFMGMGEPFANYDRWWEAVERLHDPQGFNLGARRMTVSTVGLVPGIRRLTHEAIPINLAISLHAPDDVLRNELVPINQRYPLAQVLDAAYDYTIQTGRRVSFEYVLLKETNDDPRQALALAQRLRRFIQKGRSLLFHVNLIPWNPIPGTPLSRSDRQRVLAFQKVLQDQRIGCTVRVERGTDIAAACGQLAGDAGEGAA